MVSDLWDLVLKWVAEEQRNHRLSRRWGSVISYNGDKLLTISKINKRTPSIVIFDDRFESHEWALPSMNLMEVRYSCTAADPTFFEQLYKAMCEIERVVL